MGKVLSKCSYFTLLTFLQIIITHDVTLRYRLKVQSYKLFNNKNMIASTQITNTENFSFIAALGFKLFSLKLSLYTEN